MSEYKHRDIMKLDEIGGHYCKHVHAMTAESLHSKSAIAAELAYRDWLIAELFSRVPAVVAQLTKIKAEEYTINDEGGV